MTKNQKIIAGILVTAFVIVLSFFAVGWYTDSQSKIETPANNETSQVAEPKIEFSKDGKEVKYQGQDGKTALAVLQSLTEVSTKESAYGTMIVGINGLASEDNKNYWAIYVNDAYATEGAGTLKTNNSDSITWKLEDIQ
ncbi:DUF4430 domain-containing protein [Candidatus Saccharibacteria bacterium]|nr:DUF4430 domain-containing protein [Candidatus Saccharibacteria bacterium]NCU40397.1 DUF4430 domain-containing protein [Candidatus Saccharibacteria bacterium]